MTSSQPSGQKRFIVIGPLRTDRIVDFPFLMFSLAMKNISSGSGRLLVVCGISRRYELTYTVLAKSGSCKRQCRQLFHRSPDQCVSL